MEKALARTLQPHDDESILEAAVGKVGVAGQLPVSDGSLEFFVGFPNIDDDEDFFSNHVGINLNFTPPEEGLLSGFTFNFSFDTPLLDHDMAMISYNIAVLIGGSF